MNVNDKEFAMLDEVVGSIYNRGIKDGSADVKMRAEGAYEKGLEDAWECAGKIYDMHYRKISELFPDSTHDNIFIDYSASEAMQKIKECEERQKDDEKSCGTCKHVMRIDCGAYPCNECPRDTLPKWEPKQTDDTDIDDGSIKVGDEVILKENSSYNNGEKALVIAYDGKAYPYNVMLNNGDTVWVREDSIERKTGRYFSQIAEVLEQLRGDKG